MTNWLFGGGSSTKSVVYTGVQIQTSALNLPIPIAYGRNRMAFDVLYYTDFEKHKQSAKGGKGGGGKGGNYTYTAAVILGLGWGIISDIPSVYMNQNTVTTLAKLGFTLFTGTTTQTPWGYVVAHHPTEALSYARIAYIANEKLDLGSSATIPSMDLEYLGIFQGSMPGTDDVNMADVIVDYFTNPLYGCGLTSGQIDNTSNTYYKTYIQAQGLFMSPVLFQQEKVGDTIDRWAQLTNSWIFDSGITVKFVPLGDEAITANGVTYTPTKTIQYDLTVTNGFVDPKVPIKVNRKDPADCYNRTRVTINNRANQYNSNPVEFKDQTLVDEFGFRDNNDIQGSEITELDVGFKVATLIGKRAAYVRNTYEFTLTSRFIRLEPGDLVTITHPFIAAIDKLPVRIKTTKIQADGNIAMTAEEYPGILGTVTLTDQQVVSYTTIDTQVDPGNVNTPAICEPNSSFAGEPVLLISASGGPDWGGANVYLSFDAGVTYTPVGQISSTGRQGLLTSTLPTHAAGLDTTNTLAVDMTQSLTVLEPVNNADASSFRTLSLVAPQPIANVIQQGELVAYGSVATTGSYTANLTYLERGLYGTPPALHAIGEEFTFYDISGSTGNTVRYVLPAQYIGQTVYVKLQSFNIFGNAAQDISTVTAYQYTPVGSGFGGGAGGVPLTPTGLTVSPGSGQNLVSWSANAVTDNVTSYQLWVASGVGSPFSSATKIWEGQSTNYIHTGLVSGSAFTYFVIAVNAIGPSGHTAGVSGTASAPPASVPAGGTTGQALTKNSGTDYDTGWTGPYVPLAGAVMGGVLQSVAGSSAAPGFAVGEAPSGFYLPASGVIGIATNNSNMTMNFSANSSGLGGALGFAMQLAGGANIQFLTVGEGNVQNVLRRQTNTANAAASQTLLRGRGTIAAPLKVALADVLGALQFSGQGTSGSASGTPAAIIRSTVTETGTVSATAMGADLRFLLNAIGSVTPAEVARLSTAYQALGGPVTIGSFNAPATSAALDIQSTTGALLLSRMTTTQKNALTATPGMVVYDTTVPGYFRYNGTAWYQFSLEAGPYSKQVPTTGFSITIADGLNYLILVPAGTLAAGTVTMPANPIDGQEVSVASTQIITALTLSPNTGQSIVGAVSTLAANDCADYKYVAATTTWYKISPVGSGSGTVTTTGSPASGNLTKFSGATSITNGDLSGDVATSGSLVTTIKNDVALAGNPTTTTQSATDVSTRIATTAQVAAAIANAIAAVNPAVAVSVATTVAGDTSGLTYANGTSGVGATLTGAVNTAITIDGHTFTTVGERLLVKNDTQSPSGAFNGIYSLTQLQTVSLAPVFTRAADYNQPSDINNTGAVPVVNGTLNTLTSWLLTSTVATVGTSPLTYVQFSFAPVSAANPTATASDVAVNGSAATFMRSDAAPAVQKADNTHYGLVKPDGISVIISGGLLSTSGSAPSASTYHPGYQAGRYYGTPTTNSPGTQSTVANTLYATPFYCSKTTTFTKIGFRVSSGGAGNCEMGLYANSNGIPGALITDFGSNAVVNSAFNTLTGLTITLTPGWYWLVLAFSSASVVVEDISGLDVAQFLGVTDPNNGAISMTGAWTYSAGALPNPFPAVAYGANPSPRILLGL